MLSCSHTQLGQAWGSPLQAQTFRSTPTLAEGSEDTLPRVVLRAGTQNLVPSVPEAHL